MIAKKLAGLEPAEVFAPFEAIASIPHGSWNTGKLADFLVSFAEERDLRYIRDEWGNVVIFKNASRGYEDHIPVILQGHLDMVCEKDPDCTIDMTCDGLDLTHEGDRIWARGTSLGADDGLGMAYILAVLNDPELPHPPIEAVFTNEEEVGMSGALGLDTSVLRGRRLINMDTFSEGVFSVGCAGGAKADILLQPEQTACEGDGWKIMAESFCGGHSGGTIHLNHTNCIKEMASLLAELRAEMPVRLTLLQGGAKPNSIPRETTAVIVIPKGRGERLRELCAAVQARIRGAYDEPAAVVRAVPAEAAEAFAEADTNRMIDLLCAVPNGLQKWSEELPGVVQTSLSIGCIGTKEGFKAEFQLRSSVLAEKEALKETLANLSAQYGFTIRFHGENPAWPFRSESPLRRTMEALWMERFGVMPKSIVPHVGLECGIFSEKIPGLDCVSTCSNAYDVHSNRESLSISSAQRFWPYLKELLSKL